MSHGVQLQRDYYTRTAERYEALHVHGDDEHDLACALIHGLSRFYDYTSVLDVGSGTGRAVQKLGLCLPSARIIGVEPVEALRKVGYARGIPEPQLVAGDATELAFPDSSFDLVCELGVLHHIPQPRRAVAEMLRVARKAVFFSDSNRFGQGVALTRYFKLMLWATRLWPLVNFVRTKGKGYHYKETDGVLYSYSIFDDYRFIRSHCRHVMVFNLDGSGKNALTGATHVGVFGIKSGLDKLG